MIRSLVFGIFLSLLSASSAVASLEVALKHMQDPALVGEARLKFLFWKVYDAELYAPDGVWSETEPFALSFTYLRKVSSKQIADRMVKELRSQGFDDEELLEKWRQISLDIFPDVKKGTRIVGVRDVKGHAQFYEGDKPIGSVDDPFFTAWFFRIWLGENTSVPKFRDRLIGKEIS